MERKIETKDPFNMTDRKRNIILGIMAVVLFAAIVICFFINIPLTEETYYSTFSTIAETTIALVAFLGAVVIFRLQLYENKRNYLAERIASIALTGDPLIPQFIGSTLVADEIIETAKMKVEEVDGLLTRARVKKMLEEVDNIDFSSATIKTRIKDFSLMAVCSAILSIIGLFLTPFLFGWIVQSASQLGSASVSIGNVYLFCVTIFSCFALIFGLRVILEIFNSF